MQGDAAAPNGSTLPPFSVPRTAASPAVVAVPATEQHEQDAALGMKLPETGATSTEGSKGAVVTDVVISSLGETSVVVVTAAAAAAAGADASVSPPVATSSEVSCLLKAAAATKELSDGGGAVDGEANIVATTAVLPNGRARGPDVVEGGPSKPRPLSSSSMTLRLVPSTPSTSPSRIPAEDKFLERRSAGLDGGDECSTCRRGVAVVSDSDDEPACC